MNQAGMGWLAFVLVTVASFGVYGVFLHSGQMNMADPVNGRYKSFLFVGIAYFLIAVLAPLAMMLFSGSDWNIPVKGAAFSLIAGSCGAVGAFCILLAFGAKGSPVVVMSIVFAGAPVVNAVVSIGQHPPAAGLASVRWQFFAGIALAALGGCLVTLYKPPAAPTAAKSSPVHASRSIDSGR